MKVRVEITQADIGKIFVVDNCNNISVIESATKAPIVSAKQEIKPTTIKVQESVKHITPLKRSATKSKSKRKGVKSGWEKGKPRNPEKLAIWEKEQEEKRRQQTEEQASLSNQELDQILDH